MDPLDLAMLEAYKQPAPAPPNFMGSLNLVLAGQPDKANPDHVEICVRAIDLITRHQAKQIVASGKLDDVKPVIRKAVESERLRCRLIIEDAMARGWTASDWRVLAQVKGERPLFENSPITPDAVQYWRIKNA
jgi:hypothetical protein